MTEQPNTLGLKDNTVLLHRISDRLAERFSGIFTAETVERYVFESYTALARTAKISTYLPATTEHFANDRLNALAEPKGAFASEVPEVLFVCVQNAGRSQMAAALLKVEAKGRIRVRSAGSLPAAELDPAVVTAMAEKGLDLSRDYPKPLTDDVVRASDIVITMGCGDSCPIYPGKRYEDWDLTDTANQSLDTVRDVRDKIHDRVKALVASLLRNSDLRKGEAPS
ncbi:arsenate reductase ArsC [Arthrobacter sp. ISL-30]|uniref:arsenate reductase ArsC n=1 Tax=Arthrobacter sp. ISL-30 TaxID=2819109 RepID=UPI001BEC8BD0|nr:arsenate reductase ArsC [Arthrobacter sp. ISL-30]MBT2514591.1 arsenate reductase ArsC [Arthrobacter sp. ISL-30]